MLEPIEEVSTAQTNLTDEKLSGFSQIIYASGHFNQILIDNGITEEELKSALSRYHLKLAQQAGVALTGGTSLDGTDYSPRAAGLQDVLTAPHTIPQLCTEILELKRIIQNSRTPRAA